MPLVASSLAVLAQTVPEVDIEEAIGQGLTAEDWLLAGATFVGFVVAGRLVRALVERLIRRTDSDGQIARIVGRIVQNLLALVGFVYALNVLEVQIGPLLGALGIGGIAIAFAMTAILENVLASVWLKTRRPIHAGDQITTNEHSGTVEEINFRTVVLRNFDGEMVVIPSSQVANEAIVNHTRHGRRRTAVVVGVHYDTDLELAQRTILDAVRGVDGVLPVPDVQAWVTTFNESSIDFEVRFWHAPDIASLYRVRSAVAMAIKGAFDAEGIEIPFPQRVLTMADQGGAGAGTPDTGEQPAATRGSRGAGGTEAE